MPLTRFEDCDKGNNMLHLWDISSRRIKQESHHEPTRPAREMTGSCIIDDIRASQLASEPEGGRHFRLLRGRADDVFSPPKIPNSETPTQPPLTPPSHNGEEIHMLKPRDRI